MKKAYRSWDAMINPTPRRWRPPGGLSTNYYGDNEGVPPPIPRSAENLPSKADPLGRPGHFLGSCAVEDEID